MKDDLLFLRKKVKRDAISNRYSRIGRRTASNKSS